jgi:uncharacterized protein
VRAQSADMLDHLFTEASRLLDQGLNQQAFSLFLRAAERGHAHAQHNVALLLESGLGTKRDPQSAVHWYVRSWRRNPQSSTAENLASLYAELGNRERARFWQARAR